MAVIATFLVNLLCSIVSCDPKLPGPEIGIGPPIPRGTVGGNLEFGSRIRSSASSSIFSRLIPPTTGGRGSGGLFGDENNYDDPVDVVVGTKSGKLGGYSMRTAGNRRIFAFEGVPYAQPPIGKARFRAPSPILPWEGIRDAKKPGPECLQLSLPRQLRVVGSEDCLHLSIYTPTTPPPPPLGGRIAPTRNSNLPVVVVLHGGSYYFGSGNELGPSYLLDKDVILVTLNSRLGVLGFLSTGDQHSPGNYGLKDQSLAIKWVYENVAFFGGDPKRITLFGQNSGGSSAHLHLLSNGTNGYIRSGVSLSGSAFSHWAIKSSNESRRLTKALAKTVHCPTTQGSEALMNCLRLLNPVDLVAAQYSLFEFSPFPSTLFSPVIEPPSADAFLTQRPRDAYHNIINNNKKHNYGNRVKLAKPWIFSHAVQEGYLGLLMLQSFVTTERNLRSRWNELAPIYLDYAHTPNLQEGSTNKAASAAALINETTNLVSKFYFGHKTPQTVKESKIAAAFGDRLTLCGVDEAIQAHSRVAPTYAYIFGFKGKYTLGRGVGRTPQNWGVGSGEDLYYYFNSSSNLPGFKKADVEEVAMSNVMTTFLSNFASTGEPQLPQESGVYSGLWDPAVVGSGGGSSSIKFLQLNREIRMIPQPFKKRLHFWKRLAKSNPAILDPLFLDVH